ncbi:hypothetical protein CH1034_170050 [Klebsiella pneumoniae]|nr:hypothetical protein CH1034_170050 [Klebsiella pneumoniae]SAL93865.1 hypothetical protein KPHVMX_80016 [Klebsiella pneumoniae]
MSCCQRVSIESPPGAAGKQQESEYESEGKTQDRLVAVGDRCAGAGYLGMADPQCAAAELPDAGSSQRGSPAERAGHRQTGCPAKS